MLNPLDVAVGKRLHDRRRALRLSQALLALSLGVSKQQLQKYELGASRLPASTLICAAAALRCAASDFLGDTERLTEREREILSAFEMLDEEQTEAILAVAHALSGLARRPRKRNIKSDGQTSRTADTET